MGARFAILGAAHVERGGSAELKEDQHGIPVTIAASAPDGCQELRGFSFAELLDIGQRRARLQLSNVRRSI
jgi:hypothetical protein